MFPYEQMLLSVAASTQIMRPALIVLFAIFAVLAISTLVLTVIALSTRRVPVILLVFLYIVTILSMVCCFYCNNIYKSAAEDAEPDYESSKTVESTQDESIPSEESTEATEEETTLATTEPEIIFEPAMTEKSDPANWNVSWTIAPADGSETFTMPTQISFGEAEEFYPLPGVPTFRGNNYRTGSTYGNVEVSSEELSIKWTNTVGSLNGWSGIGWTGQPLVVQWDEPTKQIMGLYDEKKSKPDLVEVIATTLDGYIY